MLYQYLQNVQAYIAPPITAVFVLGILWKRMTAQAAIATLFYGLISGTLRIVLELMKDNLGGIGEWYATVNFSHFAIFNFIVCVLVAIVVSLFTPKPSEAQIKGLTLGTLTPEQRKANRESYTMVDIVMSLLLVAIVISLLLYFRG